ncbi:MAG: hypothetical protein U5L96_08215 [Owenweeksia sp.]|nr:hypothetical protein [Owenweeksia sp.]
MPGGTKAQHCPEANVTVSGGCKGGPCSALNDLNLGSCTNSQVYISTSNPPSNTPGVDFIEWNWSSQKTFNKIVIHHGSGLARLLQGGTMQKWDGSQWVTTGTFSGLSAPACTNVVSLLE